MGFTGARHSTFMRREHQPEGGSQGGQLRKDGPVSRTHHEHHLLPRLLLWATPRAGRKAELWQAPAWGNQGARRRPDLCRTDQSAFRKWLRAGKGPAMALFGPHASRHLPAPPESGDQEEAGPGWPSALTLSRQELRAHPRCTAHLREEASSRCSLVGAST